MFFRSNIEHVNKNFENSQSNNYSSITRTYTFPTSIKQFSINSDAINFNSEKSNANTSSQFNHDYIDDESILNADITSDLIDENINIDVKNNLIQSFSNNNIFDEIKQVYVDEQKVMLSENFGNLENLNKDLGVVESLELQVNINFIIHCDNACK